MAMQQQWQQPNEYSDSDDFAPKGPPQQIYQPNGGQEFMGAPPSGGFNMNGQPPPYAQPPYRPSGRGRGI